MAAALRFTGLGWGIPSYAPHLAQGTPLRSTYHPDEDIIVEQLYPMNAAAGDIRPRAFVWGTFHSYLVGSVLGAAAASGAFGSADWRPGFREGGPDHARVFVVGRAVSALLGLGSVALAFVAGRHLGGAACGLAAALFLAVMPLAVVQNHYLTNDSALSFWILTAFVLTLQGRSPASGFALGLATATKITALALLPLVVLGARGWRRAGLAALAMLAGFLAGEPHAVLSFEAWFARLRDVAWGQASLSPASHGLPAPGWFLVQVILYGCGVAGAPLLAMGLWRDRRLLAAAFLLTLPLLATWITLCRYLMPLLPLIALAQALGLGLLRSRALRLLAVAATVLPGTAISLGQLDLMRDTHTAERASRWMEANIPRGSRVGQLWSAYPILDRARWQVSTIEGAYSPESAYEPRSEDFIVLHDLSVSPFRQELRRDLEANYVSAAVFRREPRIGRMTLPEPLAAHDWKYTHPEIRIYERKPDASRR